VQQQILIHVLHCKTHCTAQQHSDTCPCTQTTSGIYTGLLLPSITPNTTAMDSWRPTGSGALGHLFWRLLLGQTRPYPTAADWLHFAAFNFFHSFSPVLEYPRHVITFSLYSSPIPRYYCMSFLNAPAWLPSTAHGCSLTVCVCLCLQDCPCTTYNSKPPSDWALFDFQRATVCTNKGPKLGEKDEWHTVNSA